jgi:hypothetical protein
LTHLTLTILVTFSKTRPDSRWCNVAKKRQLLFVPVFAFPTIIEIWLQLVVATNAKKL